MLPSENSDGWDTRRKAAVDDAGLGRVDPAFTTRVIERDEAAAVGGQPRFAGASSRLPKRTAARTCQIPLSIASDIRAGALLRMPRKCSVGPHPRSRKHNASSLHDKLGEQLRHLDRASFGIDVISIIWKRSTDESTGDVSGSPDVPQLQLMPRKYGDVETSTVMIRGRFGAGFLSSALGEIN
jgi:hypothetical protein